MSVLSWNWLSRCACAAALALLPAACGPRDTVANTLFAGPSGLAVAGPGMDRVFVANRGTDSVQVLALAASVHDTDFVASRARYFPLHLPVGTEPTELAAGGGGAFVFVLDQVSATISAIDANQLAVLADPNGRRLRVGLGTPASTPRRLVGDLAPACTATTMLAAGTCTARTFVTLKALGAIAVVDLRTAADGSQLLVVDETIVIGGQPEAIAMGEAGTLFVTDDAAPEVVRIRLGAPGGAGRAVDRFAIGALGGRVAATAQAVAVTRPAFGDVVVLAAPAGSSQAASDAPLVLRDGDPVFAPAPQCLLACDNLASSACAGAHPADAALCLDGNGYGQPAQVAPYGALVPSGQPTALAALDNGSFSVVCRGGEQANVFGSGFAVASLSGGVEWIGLTADQTPVLIDQAFCQVPTLGRVSAAQAPLSDVLAPCPASPPRKRFACVQQGPSSGQQDATPAAGALADAGVLALRGSDQERIGLLWEGVLPGGDGRDGQARIDAEGVIRRQAIDALDFAQISALQVRREGGHGGDIFEVVSQLNLSPACLAQVGEDTRPCALERRIVALQPPADGQPAGLVLDRPLPAACFEGGLAYQIRAGDGFLAGRLLSNGQLAADTVARVNPGQRYGPAESRTPTLPVSLAVRQDLDVAADLPACERYGAGGRALDATAPWRSRLGVTAGQVNDPARRLQLAGATDPSGQLVSQLGFLPHALAFTAPSSPGGIRLLVSFAGSNSLYLTDLRSSQDFVGEQQQSHSRLYTN